MTVLPYGAWPSPITAEMLATAGVGLSEPLLDDGIVYWTEQRPTEERPGWADERTSQLPIRSEAPLLTRGQQERVERECKDLS